MNMQNVLFRQAGGFAFDLFLNPIQRLRVVGRLKMPGQRFAANSQTLFKARRRLSSGERVSLNGVAVLDALLAPGTPSSFGGGVRLDSLARRSVWCEEAAIL